MKALVAIFLLFIILPTRAFPFSSSQNQVRHVLILIGYADDAHVNSLETLIKHPHFNSIANYTETMVRNFFAQKAIVERSSNQFESPDHSIEFVLLNSNVDCAGENPSGQNIRSNGCQEQVQRSKEIMASLSRGLNQYDEMIYIGHARNGLGLGVGPFVPEFTFRFEIYNSIERGKLKRVMIAACDSEKYYGNFFREQGIEFVGSNALKLAWPAQSLPMMFSELDLLIQ